MKKSLQLSLSILLLVSLAQGCHSNDKLVPVPQCEPSEETCDGRDNDCDGRIDDDLIDTCSSICGTGFTVCRAGIWSECGAPKPSAEVCDGVDNDCDGQTDEEEELGVSPCYDGDPKNLIYGECRFGINRCIGGTWTCVGPVYPAVESCDGKDNDCDGQVDEGTAGGLDLVFAIDYSGSMGSVIFDLKSVTSAWAQKYASRGDLRIALVGIPSDTDYDSEVSLMKDLSSPQDFSDEVARHSQANGYGNEPSLDVVWAVSSTTNPLGLSWSPNNRRSLIIYTDEEPQSYLYPSINETVAMQMAAAAGVKVFVFTSDSRWFKWSPRPFSVSTQLEFELDKVVQEGSCN